MKSKILLVLVGITVITVVALSTSVSNNKQTTSAKASQTTVETVVKTVVIKDVDSGRELTCVMKAGVCHVYPSGSRISFSKRSLKR